MGERRNKEKLIVRDCDILLLYSDPGLNGGFERKVRAWHGWRCQTTQS